MSDIFQRKAHNNLMQFAPSAAGLAQVGLFFSVNLWLSKKARPRYKLVGVH
jgi:hypothetical protein